MLSLPVTGENGNEGLQGSPTKHVIILVVIVTLWGIISRNCHPVQEYVGKMYPL